MAMLNVQCLLTVVDLENAPSCEALSYTWGHGRVTQYILCNRKSIDITANLDEAIPASDRNDTRYYGQLTMLLSKNR
jgi:hypothetical protein